MDPSDPHQGHMQVMDSRHVLAGNGPSTPMGLPGSSADLSACAVPYHPGRPDGCICSLLPRRRRASPLSGGLATSSRVTRPKQVRLRYGSCVRLPGLRRWNGTSRRSVGYLLNKQLARQPPFRLQGQPGFAWRTRERGEDEGLLATKGTRNKMICGFSPFCGRSKEKPQPFLALRTKSTQPARNTRREIRLRHFIRPNPGRRFLAGLFSEAISLIGAR